jgi:hypothetical protein
MIPGLGLVLGPLGIILGWRTLRRAKGDPTFTTPSPAIAAILLGGLLTLTHWIGLALMIAAWHSTP